MTGNLGDRILLRVVPKLLSWTMRLWFGTCTVTARNDRFLKDVHREDKTIIASFWHYSIIFTLFYLRKYPATVMVSASKDGEYIARLADEFGYNCVRGSKNKKGVEALKGMLRAVIGGDNGAVVADGSQGPARVAQSGALLVAARSGRPIIPMAWSASGFFSINSWDRTLIPKPFSRVNVYFGAPLYIPRKTSAEDLEMYRRRLEDELNTLYTAAWAQYGIESHERGAA